MDIPLYQVDAFTDKVFGGNPAAVCILDAWLEDDILQGIAMENNLSETAFVVKDGDIYQLRWFTPMVEIDLCGHATLASAHVIFNFVDKSADSVTFKSQSGLLTVERSQDLLSLNFPSRKPERIEADPLLIEGLGATPAEVHQARDVLALFENESQIRELVPNFQKLAALPDVFAVIITAPGENADFVSRFFAPAKGVNEDPVTGSAHCTLIPFWAERLGKSKLHARQLSRREGELFCEDQGERVRISGKAVLYATGKIYL